MKKYTIINPHNLKGKKIACLTLDVEQDYGDLLDEPSYEGLYHIDELVSFLEERNIPLTCFVQGSLLETHPAQIKQLSILDVEFEQHSYSHPRPQEMDARFEIERGKEAYKRFFGKDPIGYRAPLGVIKGEDYGVLASNGFRFDSSIFPSLMLGIFNNLSKPTRPYRLNNSKIIELPFTVFSDLVRIPIALSYIKLLGKPYLYLLKTFHLPNLIIFDFHLHDLWKLNSAEKLRFKSFPFTHRMIYKRIYHKEGLSVLDTFIGILLKKGYVFLKLKDVYNALLEEEP